MSEEHAGEIVPHWISYYVPDAVLEAFEYHGPWWISGETMDDKTIICAAVMASDEGAAQFIIEGAFDPGTDMSNVELRFNTQKAADWSPFGSDRFPQADWMRWPWPNFTLAAREPTQ